MESAIRAIGACSGRSRDKFTEFGLRTCPVGWADSRAWPQSAPSVSAWKNSQRLAQYCYQCIARRTCVAPAVRVLQEMQTALDAFAGDDETSTTASAAGSDGAAAGAAGTNSTEELQGPFALQDCVAHMLCRVQRSELYRGHYLLTAVIEEAYVRAAYWDGRTFSPVDGTVPPILTFLGSGTFGHVVRAQEQQWH